MVGFRTLLICGFACLSQLFPFVMWCVFSQLPTLASAQNLFQRRHSQTLSAITTFDPVSDSTPTVVGTAIDKESVFTEAHNNMRVLLS